jgi:hypothetical protein
MKSLEVSTQDIGRQANQASERVVHETSPWIERLGRFGHIAIGIVYATIGVLAAQTALSQGGGTTDSHGALAWIVQAPFGRVILGALALGFAGYATWRCIQAVRDTESKGTTPMGVLNRLVYAFIGATYGALALSAFDLARGHAASGGDSGDAAAQDWTAWLWPGARRGGRTGRHRRRPRPVLPGLQWKVLRLASDVRVDSDAGTTRPSGRSDRLQRSRDFPRNRRHTPTGSCD